MMNTRKIWVLIVEDSVSIRLFLANQLHKKGFEIICAEDGEKATDIIKYCTPDCILLDLVMPRMHGHTFLSLLREKNSDLPVIVMSSIDDQPGLVATMKKIGINEWISKPVEPDEIAKKIIDIIGSSPN